MMTWNRDANMIVFESIVSSKKLYLQIAFNIERVSILNRFRIDCIIKKLHSSCDWSLNIFSLYDTFEIWLQNMIVRINCFVENCIFETLNDNIDYQMRFCFTIWSWFDHSFVTIKHRLRHDIDMTIRVNCFINWIAFTKNVNVTKRLNASWYCMTISINCIIRKIAYVMLLTFKFVFVVRLVVTWSLIRDYFFINVDVL